MTFNPAPTTSTTRGVVGLGRRATGDLWVALTSGALYRAAAGSDELTPVANVPAPTSTTTHADLTATDDEVLLLRGRSVFRCTGACADFADFTSVHTVASLEAPFAFCVRGTRVLFTSHLGSTTLLYESQRSGSTLTFTAVSQDLGVDRGERCVIAQSGDVYVPSSSGVAIRRATGGVATETIDLQGQAGARWTSVAVAGTGASLEGFLVGGGSGLRFARRDASTATWKALPINTDGPLMSAAVTLDEAEVFAGGVTNDLSTAKQTLFRWNGTGFVALSPAPPAIEVHRGLAAGANELYFGGAERTGSAFAVLHGTR